MTTLQYRQQKVGTRAKRSKAVLPVLMVIVALAVGIAISWWGFEADFLYPAVMLYVIGFMALAWNWPHIALALIVAATPFNVDISGGLPAKFSLSEFNLALAAIVIAPRWLSGQRKVRMGPIALPIFLYLAICILSSASNWREADAITSMLQMVLYLIIAVALFSSSLKDLTEFSRSFNLVLASCAFLAVFVIYYQSGYVLGMHKNALGDAMAVGFIVGVELWLSATTKRRSWLYLGASVLVGAALMVTLSRGAWLAAVCGVIALMGLRRNWKKVLQLAFFSAPVIGVCWVFLPQEAQDYASDFSGGQSVQARYKNAAEASALFEQNPLYGLGVGLRKEFDSTNVVLSTLAETGIIGLAAFTMIHGVFFNMVWKTCRRLTIDNPLFSYAALGGALVLAKLAHGMVDHYWSRGTLTIVWASAGMAVAVYYSTRPQRGVGFPAAYRAAK